MTGSSINRRRFVATVAAGLSGVWMAHAQIDKKRVRVAVLIQTTPSGAKHLLTAFTKRLADLGWVEGRSIEFVVRYAEGQSSRHDGLVAETLAEKPDLIYAPFGPFALAAKKQTSEVPIVFAIVDDPVGIGLVASLPRPGGNVTGVSTRSRELMGKQVQLLKELVPTLKRIGIAGAVTTSEHVATIEEFRLAAKQFGVEAVEVRVAIDPAARSPIRDFDFAPVFAQFARARVDAVAGLTYLVYPLHREFVQTVQNARLPAVYDAEEFVDAGGLMSYAVSFVERYNMAAAYVDRILRGTKPADLPVEEPTRFYLTLNLRTARALGLKIPQSMFLRADRTIE